MCSTTQRSSIQLKIKQICKGKHEGEKGLLFFEGYVLKPLVTVPGKTTDCEKNPPFYSLYTNFLLNKHTVFEFLNFLKKIIL